MLKVWDLENNEYVSEWNSFLYVAANDGKVYDLTQDADRHETYGRYELHWVTSDGTIFKYNPHVLNPEPVAEESVDEDPAHMVDYYCHINKITREVHFNFSTTDSLEDIYYHSSSIDPYLSMRVVFAMWKHQSWDTYTPIMEKWLNYGLDQIGNHKAKHPTEPGFVLTNYPSLDDEVRPQIFKELSDKFEEGNMQVS